MTGTRTVLWAVPVSDLAGVARHTLDVLGRGVPGWEVVLLAPDGPLVDRAVDLGGAVEAAAFGPRFGLAASVRSLAAAVRRVRPAVVHSHLAYADLVAAALPLGRAARVSTEHGIAPDDRLFHRGPVERRAMALAHALRLRRTAALVGVSEATLDAVRSKWHPGRGTTTVLIRNGVDPGPARAPGPSGLRIGALARLAPEKGLHDLIDAFALVVRDHPAASLRIAGTGPEGPALAARAARRGVESSVELCGHVEPAELLGEIDVLAQLSRWENCSYSLLDALAAGRGVVATRVGGNPEMLPDRCLVALGDVAGAAAALVVQGLDPDARPTWPDGWPGVGEMCTDLAALYDGATARRTVGGA